MHSIICSSVIDFFSAIFGGGFPPPVYHNLDLSAGNVGTCNYFCKESLNGMNHDFMYMYCVVSSNSLSLSLSQTDYPSS